MKRQRGNGWILGIPPSFLAPLGAFIYMPPKGESVTFDVQGPLTREEEDNHQATRLAFARDMGRLVADLYFEGKLGCPEHNNHPLDIVVDTPKGSFAACSDCYAAGIYEDTIGVPRPR